MYSLQSSGINTYFRHGGTAMNTRGAQFTRFIWITIICIFLILIGGNTNYGSSTKPQAPKVLTVNSGDTFSYLCFKMYRNYNKPIAEIVRKFNPEIKNIDALVVGQKIRFPRLSQNDTKAPTDKLQPRDAYLTYLRGDVYVRPAHSQNWGPARVNGRLRPGAKLRLGEDAHVEIITFDQDIIRLSEKSELTLSYLQMNPVQKIKKKGLFLKAGRMWNKAKILAHAESEYTVWTPHAVASIQGTAFNIDVSAQKTTRIKTYSGAVKVWRFDPRTWDAQKRGITAPVPITGPHPVTMEQWIEIILKLHEELIINRRGARKRVFDPQHDEANDDWIKLNRDRDRDFKRFEGWH